MIFTVQQLASHMVHHQLQQQHLWRVKRDIQAQLRLGHAAPAGWAEHIGVALETVAATISTIGLAMAQVPAANDS